MVGESNEIMTNNAASFIHSGMEEFFTVNFETMLATLMHNNFSTYNRFKFLCNWVRTTPPHNLQFYDTFV